ncbi:MAG: 23S rRNA (uracil(1939)-C(5))-methyltransferase RlmD [Candidatus Omnitrophica bacterium]|nr:23S rRNA (uracil(1939)-C(5))-methyltransferase RlmD [Candidatus Omnitrophota bacterium]
MRIILASKSERRKELLKRICKNFEVIDSNFDESKIDEKEPVKYAIYCAIEKAKIVGEKYPDAVVIGADTIVSLNNEIIGKPSNYKEAKEILKKLSGTEHQVITGIALYKKEEGRLISDYELSYVKFRNIKDEEIEEYLNKEDFLDKAGAYGIQDIKDRFVEYIKGDFDNVVGLPVEKLKRYLEDFVYEEVNVEIYDIAFPNNWGVGRCGNLVIFVPQAVIGDRVKIRVLKPKKNFSFGEILEIEKPSEYRVIPECEHFGICGGCVLQNFLYEKQIEIKKKYLIHSLKKIGNIENINLKEIIPSPEIYFYRNKMEFAFGIEEKLVIGLRERSLPYKKYTKKVVPLKNCSIFSKKIGKIFPIVCEFFSSMNLPPYDPFKKTGVLRHLVIKESKVKDEMMLVFVTKSKVNIDFSKLIDLLVKEIKEIKSIYWVENDQLSDVVSYEKKHLLYGKEYIEERIKNLIFRIYPETFFQPNTKTTEILYEKIKENIKEGSNVLSLFCGTGPIEIFISEKVKNVIGVDWDNSNINTANENSLINNIKNCRFYVENVDTFLNRDIFNYFDHLIVDPPRGGLSKKSVKKILKKNILNIIYVSCNPSTLARDLNEIIKGGYILKDIYLIDCFPHTTHIESVAILEKI